MHGNPGNARLDDAMVEATAEVAWLDGRAMASGEDQAGFDPGIPGALAVSVLLFLAELERGNAQVDEGKGRFRCLCLDLAAKELATDTLDLFAYVKLGGIEVDQLPGEPKYLSLAQAHDKDEDECRLQRLAATSGRFQEPPGVIDSPSSTPAFT